MVQILDLLEDAARTPGRIRFLSDSSDPVPLAAVWDASTNAASWFRERIGAGGTVAGVLEASQPALAALVGAWRCGVTFASLPGRARGVSQEEYATQIRAMTSLVEADALLMCPAEVSSARAAGLQATAFDEVLTGRLRHGEGQSAAGRLIQFTSGSTGAPKGIVLTPEALAANLQAIIEVLAVERNDVGCSWLPLSHDMGLIGMCLASWASSGRRFAGSTETCLVRTQDFVRRPTVWMAACSTFGATITAGPTFAVELARRRLQRTPKLDLAALRRFIVGAEMVDARTLRGFADAAAPFGFSSTAFTPAYGLAEASLAVAMVRPQEHWREVRLDTAALAEGRWNESEAGSTSCVSNGRPLPGVTVTVNASSPASPGELLVDSPAAMVGTVGTNGFVATHQPILTGDLGYVGEDGEVFVLGRTNDALKVHGRTVWASDLETTVSQHEAIRAGSCAVVGVVGGIAVIAEPAARVERGTLPGVARTIRSNVVESHGVRPEVVAFVERGSMPRTPSGKIRRLELGKALDDDALDVLAIVRARH